MGLSISLSLFSLLMMVLSISLSLFSLLMMVLSISLSLFSLLMMVLRTTDEIQQKRGMWHNIHRLLWGFRWQMTVWVRSGSSNCLVKYSSFCSSVNPLICVTYPCLKISDGSCPAATGRLVIHRCADGSSFPFRRFARRTSSVVFLVTSDKMLVWKLNSFLYSSRPSKMNRTFLSQIQSEISLASLNSG